MTENSNKKIFLVDAYALIYRAYYAFINNPRMSSKGVNTSAVFGFVNTLWEILNKENPSRMIVVFDPPGLTFRHEMYEPYKAQREKTPEDIKSSIPYIKKILDGFRIKWLYVDGYEADDVIGSLAVKAEKEGYESYMVTPDKDYGQLVTDKIKQYKPRRFGNGIDILGPEEICERHAIKETVQVIDILALMGDASDNIPGAKGVGEKTAKKFIKEYGSVENLLAHIDDLSGKMKENIQNNIENIKISKELVTIKTDVKISLDDRDCQIQEPDKEALIHAFDELEFRTFIARLTEGKTAPTKKKSEAGVTQMSLFDQPEPAPTTISNMDSIENVEHDYQLVEDKKTLQKIVGQIKNSGVFCFDTETTGLNPHEAEILGIAITVAEGKAFYVPCNTEKLPMKIIRNVLSPLFEDPELLKVGQNIKYDIIVLHYAKIVVAGPLFDTMLAHYLLQPEARHNMDFLAETYLNYQTVSIEELIGKKGVNQGNMKDVPLETLKEYACEDADVTLRLFHVLQKEIQKNNLEDIANHIEMPLVYVLAQMECNGVYIDKDSLAVFAEKLKKQLQEVEKNIYELADNKTFNIASPKQLGEVLFDQLKIDEKAKRTKTKQYSTSEETLEKLKDKHPIINKILEYRGLKKLISTYVEALPLLINSKTGKIHTSYNQSVTSTGRLSSTNPNLQNIPIREEQGREIRKAFVSSEKEHVLLAADYSQIELRIMAHLSEDKAMQEAFKNNEDIHTSTAAKIYGVRPEEITSDQRRKAKTANFGIIYGISPFGLSQRLSIPRAEADDLIKGYFTSYPGVRDYMEQVKENARGKGFVQTIFGRRRYLRDINSSNAIVRGVAERNAINAPIQGSAADLIKMAMIRIYEELKKSKLSAKMILQVHDELVFDVSTDELGQLKKLVQKEMENIYKLDVPLIVDMGAGNSWLEAH